MHARKVRPRKTPWRRPCIENCRRLSSQVRHGDFCIDDASNVRRDSPVQSPIEIDFIQTTSELFVICGSKNDEILSGGFGAIVGSMLSALIIGLINSSVFFVLLVILQSILANLNMDESRRQRMSGAMLLVLVLFYGRGRAMRA
jgi:hypothetical protein